MFNVKEIDKNNLIHNIKQVKQNNPNALICAMVKANAYGVGLKQVVKILSPYADYFGVACFFEACQVKKLCNNPVLIVGALEMCEIDNSFSYSCNSLADVEFLKSLFKPIRIHLKINSGMNRFGFKSLKEFKLALQKIKHSLLYVEGIFTHFATADCFVERQMKKFNKFVKVCNSFGFNPLVHADNSVVNEKYNHKLDMVRIGFNLYNGTGKFKRVLKIKSKIIKINKIKKGELVGYNYRFVAKKNMRVGVVPIGYADGFDMHYIGINLYINNFKCKVLNICMDCFMLDITNTNLTEQTEIEILNEKNSLKKYAKYSLTSEYEVGTKFSFLRGKTKIKK